MAVDFWILDFIQAYLRSAIMDVVMPVITLFGDGGIFWIACTLVMLIVPKTRRVGIVMAISLALEALCCNVAIKPLVARVRPYTVRTDIVLLVRAPKDFSFPSGHTGASFAVMTAMLFARKRLAEAVGAAAARGILIPACVLAFLIAFSRLYLYVHYPTDVLAGIAIGTLTGWIANLVMELVWKKTPEKNEEDS